MVSAKQNDSSKAESIFHVRTGFIVLNILALTLFAITSNMLYGYPDSDFSLSKNTLTLVEALYAIPLVSIVTICCILVSRHTINITLSSLWMILFFLIALAFYAAVYHTNFFANDAMLNAIIEVTIFFRYFVTAIFMKYGRHDPFMYGIIATLVFASSRAFTQFVLNVMDSSDLITLDSFLFVSLIGVAFLFFVWTLFLLITSPGKGAENSYDYANGIQELTGSPSIEASEQNANEVRLKTMEHSVSELGKQYFLSSREMDVLVLYALGHTQTSVAQELYISESTVHSHIKSIYAKTGLHSRQKVLDYLKEHTE